MNRHKATEHH